MKTERERVSGTSGRPAPKVQPDHGGSIHVELISIGRELLRGLVADTNAQTLAEKLSRRGALIHRITVVDDNEKAITAAIREALDRSPNMVITTGGLGPARDDRTLSALAEVLCRPLKTNVEAKSMVETAYGRLARSKVIKSAGLTRAREKNCLLPVGSIPVPNPTGIAPGVISRLAGGCAVLCLPGQPHQMKAVLEAALPLLKDVTPHAEVARREIESPTPDEAELQGLLEQLGEEFPAVWITSHPAASRKKDSKFVVTLEASADTHEHALSAVNAAQRRLLAIASGAR